MPLTEQEEGQREGLVMGVGITLLLVLMTLFGRRRGRKNQKNELTFGWRY